MVQNSFVPTLRFAPTSVWKPSEWVSSEGNKTLPTASEKKKKQSREDCMYVFFKIGVYFKIINTEIKRNLNASKIQINKSHCKNSFQKYLPQTGTVNILLFVLRCDTHTQIPLVVAAAANIIKMASQPMTFFLTICCAYSSLLTNNCISLLAQRSNLCTDKCQKLCFLSAAFSLPSSSPQSRPIHEQSGT